MGKFNCVGMQTELSEYFSPASFLTTIPKIPAAVRNFEPRTLLWLLQVQTWLHNQSEDQY
jgi:hypothetical protein